MKDLNQLPHTISFVIRKLQQIDNLSELPKEKRPTDEIIWDGTSEDLEEWIEKVLGDKKDSGLAKFVIDDIEG